MKLAFVLSVSMAALVSARFLPSIEDEPSTALNIRQDASNDQAELDANNSERDYAFLDEEKFLRMLSDRKLMLRLMLEAYLGDFAETIGGLETNEGEHDVPYSSDEETEESENDDA